MILGEEIGLNPVEEEDLPLLVAWRNHPTTRIKLLTPLLISVSGQKKWYEALLNDPTRIQFMIIRLEDHAQVGTIGLRYLDYVNRSARTAPFMVDPSQRTAAYGVDAMKTVLRYAFQDLNLHRIYGAVMDFNRTMVVGMQALGFKREGVRRKAAFVNGEFHDMICFGLLQEEWQENQG